MFKLHVVGLLLAFFSVDAMSMDTRPDLHDAVQTYEAYLADQTRGYDEVNSAYRAALAAAPDDSGLAVAHCAFIDNFIYAEDISWTDQAEADSEACATSLLERWPAVPEVLVYRIENNYDDDALVVAEALWTGSKTWPKALRMRLALRLHYLHSSAKSLKQAGRFALIAVRLGDDSVLPEAITYLADKGEAIEAIALNTAATPATDTWFVVRRINALSKLADKSAALHEMHRAQKAGVAIPAATRLRVYLDAGELVKAKLASKEIDATTENKVERAALFELALVTNKPLQAATWVSVAHDDFDVAVQRYADIIIRAPRLAFDTSLLPMTLAVLLVLVLMVLLPGVVLVPVHYRGLWRRVQGKSPLPLFDRIGVRHAWIGTAAIIVVPLVMVCVMRPDSIGALFADGGEQALFSQFGVVAASMVAGLLLLAPWLPNFGWQHLFGARAQVPRTLMLVLLSWLVAMVVSMVTAKILHLFGAGDTSTAHTKTVSALVHNTWSDHGVAAALLLMAVAVPVFEELVFRGMLLGGLSRHISFGWANTLQAVLFATVHGDPPRFAFYMTLGLLAGWLVRRHRTLWPAMLLHALNNAFYTGMLVSR